jgi:hypothetical protein
VLGVGFRRTAGITDYAGLTLDLEILLSSTTATLATLSSTFAANLGNDAAVVFPRQMINIPARAANSGPGDFIMFPTSAPWAFNGPNFLVQIKAFAPTWSSTGYRCDRCFAATTGESISFGRGCGAGTAASTGAYAPGATFNITLAAAAPNQPALSFLGFDLQNFGGVPFPLDLTALGMTGCVLLVPPAFPGVSLTDGSGAASLAVPVPNDASLSNVAMGFQWIYADPNSGNPVGFLTSNGRFVRLGPRTCPNRYVYDLFDETVPTGTLQAGGPIARVAAIP